MAKKCVIFCFLFAAYAVLLAHNFTPHAHHTDNISHHHDDADHDHDADYPYDHNEQGDQEEQAGTFHHFQHEGNTEAQYLPAKSQKYEVQQFSLWNEHIYNLLTIIRHFEKPPLIVPKARSEKLRQQQSLSYFFSLKAPPAPLFA
jgi:hypothetical protein